MSSPCPHPTGPTELRFALLLQPAGDATPWRCQLLGEGGERHEFASLRELWWHLTRLAPPPPREGGLR